MANKCPHITMEAIDCRNKFYDTVTREWNCIAFLSEKVDISACMTCRRYAIQETDRKNGRK